MGMGDWDKKHGYDFLMHEVDRCDWQQIDTAEILTKLVERLDKANGGGSGVSGGGGSKETLQVTAKMALLKYLATKDPSKYGKGFEKNLAGIGEMFLSDIIDWTKPMMFTGWSEIFNKKATELTSKQAMLRQYGEREVILSNAITYSHDKKYCSFAEY